MDLKARYVFHSPVDRVWDLLMDPKTIASCLPGCDAFEPIGTDRYRVVLNASVAAVSGSFEGTVEITDRHPPASVQIGRRWEGTPWLSQG